MAKLQIHFKTAQEVELILSDGEAVLDVLPVWPAAPSDVHNPGIDFHFDTMLVTSIDRILKKNRIDFVSLREASVTGNPDPMSVAYHVAQAAAAALKAK